MNSEREKDPEIWYKCEEHAKWLIGLKIDMGIPITDRAEDHLDKLTEEIYNNELSRVKSGLPSLFTKTGVIPDLSIPENVE